MVQQNTLEMKVSISCVIIYIGNIILSDGQLYPPKKEL